MKIYLIKKNYVNKRILMIITFIFNKLLIIIINFNMYYNLRIFNNELESFDFRRIW